MNIYCAGLLGLLTLAGCAHNPPPPQNAAAGGVQKVRSIDGTFEGEIIGTPAPGSKFAMIQIGMPMKQVTDLIGEPNDTDGHITGKAFIPFYFGGDTTQVEAFYRNEGYLSYAGTHFGATPNKLIAIHVNPAESGYAH